ncbi:putative oxidoreductase [Pseudohyphozyma bogoriensis]|nr:putative oxidoreductase [Pseudohyphozyma bogoriensis]
MWPPVESIALEEWDNAGQPYLKQYEGSGKLAGRSALITGGDSGIGKSIAVMFAREGADVSIGFLPEELADAESVKTAVEDAGRKCLLVPGNIRDRKTCQEMIEKHVKEFGQINILVNNAGTQQYSDDFSKIDLDFSAVTFEVNVYGMMALTKFAIPHMPRGSSIINTTSVGAYMGSTMSDKVDYSATKGAIVSFTRSLSQQVARKGIRVNAVAPGPVWTPLQTATKDQPEDSFTEFGFDIVPLWGRMAHPAELGPTYVFLASSAANYITGQTLHVK